MYNTNLRTKDPPTAKPRQTLPAASGDSLQTVAYRTSQQPLTDSRGVMCTFIDKRRCLLESNRTPFTENTAEMARIETGRVPNE